MKQPPAIDTNSATMIESNRPTSIDTNSAIMIESSRPTSIDTNKAIVNRVEQVSIRRKQHTRSPNLHRSLLTIYKSKYYEIFTEACIHHQQCSGSISTWLGQILIDTKLGRIDHEPSANNVGSIAWAHTRAKRGLPRSERDICSLRL